MCLLAQILKASVLDPRQHRTLDTDKNWLYISSFQYVTQIFLYHHHCLIDTLLLS